MTKTEQILLEKQQKELDRAAELHKARIGALGSITGSGVGAAGRVISALVKNDPDWYKRYTSDLSKYTNLSLAYTKGVKQEVSVFGTSRMNPGILVLKYVHSIGPEVADDAHGVNNAINTSAANFKAALRTYNSRMAGYDANDILRTMIGQVEMLEIEKLLAQALTAWNTRAGDNLYYNGWTLVDALGFNPNDFDQNIVKIRELYHKIHEMNAKELVVPKDFTYALRKLYCAGNILKEFDTPTSPLIVTTPVSLMGCPLINDQYGFRQQFDATDAFTTVETAIPLHYVEDGGTTFKANLTYSRIFARYYQLKELWVNDQSANSLLADIRSAIQEDGFLVLDEVSDDEALYIPYIPETALQLKNALLHPMTLQRKAISPEELEGTDIWVSDKGAICQGEFSPSYDGQLGMLFLRDVNRQIPAAGSIYGTGSFAIPLSFHESDINGDGIIEATRYLGTRHDLTTDEFSQTCCTEVILGGFMYLKPTVVSLANAVSGALQVTRYTAPVMVGDSNAYGSDHHDWYYANSVLGAIFENAPMRVCKNGVNRAIYANFDFDRIAFITPDELGSLNVECVKSLFYYKSKEFKHL